MKALLAAFGLAVAGVSLASAQERPDTLQLEHYFDWEQAGSPQIAPDGEDIVYTRTRVDAVNDGFASELWAMDSDGDRHRFLTRGSSAQWSPDGRRLAFIRGVDGHTQLFVRWMDAEGAESQITHEQLTIKQFRWSPDGESIAFLAETPLEPAMQISLPARPEGAQWTADPLVTDRMNYRIDRQGLKSGYDHLFVVSAEGGTPRQITAGDWDATSKFSGVGAGSFDWTPDSASLVFDGILDPEDEAASRQSDIHRVVLASGDITTLTDGDGNWANPRVSPNGRYVVYSGHAASEVNYPASHLMRMDLDGSDKRVLRADLPDGVGNPTWSDDSRGLYYTMNYHGSTDLHYITTGGSDRQITEGMHRLYVSSISEDGVAAAVHSAPQSTPNVALIDRRGDIRLLTDLNGDILDGVELGDIEEIWYPSFDGEQIQGWIIYPPDFDPNETYPMVLNIHGGPHAMYGVDFNYRFQEWAANGYVVLYTNPRGSTGYTPEFANAIDNAYPGPVDYGDLMAGVDAVLERGFVDESRMYVTGCSGGGVLTAWIVTQTDRFAAAASLCPVTNWISFTGQADISAWAFERFRPHYWEDPQLWLDHSPIMHAHQVTTPTLLMTGVKDLRTPLAQAEEFYANLRRRGVPTMLIAMNDEYHGTTSKPSNMMRTQLYLRQWFETHGEPESEEDASNDN